MLHYTNLEQSKALAKILSPVSADMSYKGLVILDGDIPYNIPYVKMMELRNLEQNMVLDTIIPCWSLSALLSVLPKSLIYTPNPLNSNYCCKNVEYDLETYGDSPIDVCVEMIVKLNEENLLNHEVFY
jgi:hypothetical protein